MTTVLLRLIVLLLFGNALVLRAQQATLSGIVLDEAGKPLEAVLITADAFSAESASNGSYSLTLPANKRITVVFSHGSHQKSYLTLTLDEGEAFLFSPVLKPYVTQLGDVVVEGNTRKITGISNLPEKALRFLPSVSGGVETLLTTLPGVSSTNELSSQYAVRGGNFDENLVYVNGFEVYRPYLVRSGAQEGLSFINPLLVADLQFFPGSFPAQYGEKLSSVLDVTYRRPVDFGMGGEISLMGGSLYAEGASDDGRLTALAGVRYRDNQLLLNAQPGVTDFRPVFTDLQTQLTYKLSPRVHLDFLGQLAGNRYEYTPFNLVTNFGTVSNPGTLFIGFTGEEEDRYDTAFGGLRLAFFPSERTEISLSGTAYQSTEEEQFGLRSDYEFFDPSEQTEGNGSRETRSLGSEILLGDNQLETRVWRMDVRGIHRKKQQTWSWGAGYERNSFADRLNENRLFIPPSDSINPEPEPETLDRINAVNDVVTERYRAFTQWQTRWEGSLGTSNLTLGLRVQHWKVKTDSLSGNPDTDVSPRLSWTFRPSGNNSWQYHLSGGYYFQPPFYRELRALDGSLQPDVQSQKSWQVAAGAEHSFTWWDRSFKWSVEAWYRGLEDLNPYTLENVRIRYLATNEARGYAYGLDSRLYGEFVPGTQSWLSLGLMRTEESIENQGYRPRPTDQRLKLGLLFQDYIPQLPRMRLYLNAVYQTGAPAAPPAGENPYLFDLRLPAYKRVDIGIHYVIAERSRPHPQGHWLHKFKEWYAGFEIFNIFDNQNSTTNLWVRDPQTDTRLAVPNLMTPRVFNLKMGMQF